MTYDDNVPQAKRKLMDIKLKKHYLKGYLDWEAIEKIQKELEEFYKDKPFVDVLPLGQVATVKHVRLSNKCAISVHENKSKIIICSAIDNMVKGSAGQAIQNMNLMLGFDECEGLSTVATAF